MENNCILHTYHPPEWAKSLNNIPRYFVKLSQDNTPITDWNLEDVPNGFKIGIKREDMTGSTLSGNKVRKLEFILADAISQNCKTIITYGVLHSNHCRTTAIAARQLGMDTCLFLILKPEESSSSLEGNRLLSRLIGCDVITMKNKTPVDEVKKKMKVMADNLGNKHKSPAYVVEGGGSSYVGMFGYINCFQEMILQNVLENYTDIFVTSGTCGTAASLAIANYLTGSKLKIHAVTISRTLDKAYSVIQTKLELCGLANIRSEDIIDLMIGYKDRGYRESTREEYDDIVKIARTTGILLDPVYNIKTVRRMLVEMKENPQRFKGKKVLYIHTGGLFALFEERFKCIVGDYHGEINGVSSTDSE